MSYPGDTPSIRDPLDPVPVDENPPVADAIGTFGRIRPKGDFLSCHDGGEFPKHRYTRRNFANNRSKIHFQGIQRSRTGTFLFISGDDVLEDTSQMFVLELGSRSADGPWGSNVVLDDDPPSGDRLVGTFVLDKGRWHGGGMSLCGDILAVPVEDNATSSILFLDVSDARSPTFFDVPIQRGPTVGKAGAVGLCKLPSGFFLCGVWSDSDPNPKRIDFYLSRTTDFRDGFRTNRLTWEFSKVLPTGGRASKYQSVNFLLGTDGALYAVGTENDSIGAPVIGGDDFADLLLIEFPDRTLGPNPILEEPQIARIAEKRFERGEDHYNLAAAGGIHIDRGSHELLVYGGFHWRVKKEIHVAEFRSDVPAGAPPVTRLRDAWIDLFEHPGFTGRRLSIYGERDHEIPDYHKIRVQDKSFGDKVSSVRYQIPTGRRYTLFEDKRFKGRALDLDGQGTVVEIPDLNQVPGDFNDEVSSSKYEAVP